jgi:ribosomal protein S18 acetylase RimI-like enzyme
MTQLINVTIRRATSQDTALLADLGARAFSVAFAKDNTPEDMADYLQNNFSHEKIAAELADADSTFFIAETEQQACGYAKLKKGELPVSVSNSNTIELERLYTLPEYFGKGVGEALMKTCFDDAKQSGFEAVWLGVWEHNLRARAFYRKLGFREIGDKIFQLGSDTQTDKVMECAL